MNDTSRYPLNKLIRKAMPDPEKEKRIIEKNIHKELFGLGLKEFIDILAQREYEAMINKYDDRARRRFYRRNLPKHKI